VPPHGVQSFGDGLYRPSLRSRREAERTGSALFGRTQNSVEKAIRQHLDAGHGILKVSKVVDCGSGTVQRVKRLMNLGLDGNL
jgi:hypothetical protein